MTEFYNAKNSHKTKEQRIKRTSIIDKVSLGLLLIWIGISLWSNLGGWGFIGAGSIIIASQLVRKITRIKMEGIWLFVGILLIYSGIGRLDIELPWGPILLIIAGFFVILSLFKRNK